MPFFSVRILRFWVQINPFSAGVTWMLQIGRGKSIVYYIDFCVYRRNLNMYCWNGVQTWSMHFKLGTADGFAFFKSESNDCCTCSGLEPESTFRSQIWNHCWLRIFQVRKQCMISNSGWEPVTALCQTCNWWLSYISEQSPVPSQGVYNTLTLCK